MLLYDLLLDTLKEFNITKQRLLARVVDNASNMTRTVQLLNEEENEDYDQGEDECEEAENSEDTITIDRYTKCAQGILQLGV